MENHRGSQRQFRRSASVHAVITSVNRDELPDGGASIFAETIRQTKALSPGCTMEVLIPDFEGNPEALTLVLDEKPDVLNHNVETVLRLYPQVRPQADYFFLSPPLASLPVRFAHAYAPLDEALARAVVDLSGRGYFAWRCPEPLAAAFVTREFPLTLVADFGQALADRGRLTLHLDVLEGRNPHHVAEAAFKALALALRRAVARRAGDSAVPSTKGALDR